jgi:hypothetical protein
VGEGLAVLPSLKVGENSTITVILSEAGPDGGGADGGAPDVMLTMFDARSPDGMMTGMDTAGPEAGTDVMMMAPDGMMPVDGMATMPDAAPPDMATPDAATPDAATPDAATPDASEEDTGT